MSIAQEIKRAYRRLAREPYPDPLELEALETVGAVAEAPQVHAAEIDPSRPGRLILRAWIDHASVEFKLQNLPEIPRTRVTAPLGDFGFSLDVHYGHVTVRSLFQDIDTGDEAFDERFIVKSSDEDLARAWLAADIREKMLAASNYRFVVKKGVVQATMIARPRSPENLLAAGLAVAALAQRPKAILTDWRRLARKCGGTLTPQAKEWRPDGSVAIEFDSHEVSIRIDSARGALRGRSRDLLMRVRAQSLDPDAARVLVVRSDLELPARVPPEVVVPELHGYFVYADQRARRFTPALVTAIADAQPAWIERAKGEVALYWRGWHADAARTTAALTAVELLATESSPTASLGPYR